MIKMIITDMDGTWLRPDKTYDQELFKKIFKLMKKRNINFAIASGNQYANILARFSEYNKQMYFVAENGALVAKGNQVLKIDNLEDDFFEKLLNIVESYDYPTIVAGVNSAYVLKKSGIDFLNENKKYYKKIVAIDNYRDTIISYRDTKDKIFKVSMIVPPDEMPKVLEDLKSKYPEVGFVAGGYDSIDLCTPNMNKATGLKFLSKKLGIESNEMMAFGDSENDVAMLKYVGKSYVTSTALPVAKKAADEIIGSSADSSVQKKLIELLEN